MKIVRFCAEDVAVVCSDDGTLGGGGGGGTPGGEIPDGGDDE